MTLYSDLSASSSGDWDYRHVLPHQGLFSAGDGRHPGFHAHLASILLIEPKIHLKSEIVNEYKSAFNLERKPLTMYNATG